MIPFQHALLDLDWRLLFLLNFNLLTKHFTDLIPIVDAIASLSSLLGVELGPSSSLVLLALVAFTSGASSLNMPSIMRVGGCSSDTLNGASSVIRGTTSFTRFGGGKPAVPPMLGLLIQESKEKGESV